MSRKMWSSTSYDGQGFWLATKRLSKGRFRWWPTGDEPARVLRRFIADNSHLSRRKLSAKVCEAWDWRQPNGALRDMVCRGLLLMLHRAGEVQLPDVRFVPRNPFVDRERPAPMWIDTTPVIATVNALRPVEVQQVRRTGDEPLFNSLMEHHHYLGYEQPVGEHLKYLIWSLGRRRALHSAGANAGTVGDSAAGGDAVGVSRTSRSGVEAGIRPANLAGGAR